MPRRQIQHASVLLLFAGLTTAWLWPVLRSLNTSIPGEGAGDNLTFVWNLWWARHALVLGAPLLWSPAIFAPFGVSLALHTHTALPDLLAALVMGNASLVAGTNTVIAVHLFLNFAVSYALAFRITRSLSAALLAALIFGWSPYIGAHLEGHFNLIAAWVLPLTALWTERALDRPSRRTAILPGLAICVAVYVDYYYAVYSLVIVGGLVLMRSSTLTTDPRGSGPGRRLIVVALAVLCALEVGATVWIFLTGGTILRFGGASISLRSTANPAAAAALSALLALAIALLPRVTLHIEFSTLYHDVARLIPGAGIGIIGALPVLIGVYRLWMAGDYITQEYFWRSAPPGIDTVTLLLGNPNALLWGALPARWYAQLRVDGVEQIAWLGPGVLALSATAILLRAEDRDVRRWRILGVFFFLWALGPYLVAFGRNLRMPLPAVLVRYVPIISNARMPGRAMIVVYLSTAILSAIGLAALRASGRGSLAAALAVLVVVDYLPRAPRVYSVDYPAVYDVLRRQTVPGAVCELPLGLRDGFGEVGKFDSRILWYQTLHERPIAGGFVARLPPRVVRGYETMPILGSLLRLSSGSSMTAEPRISADQAGLALRREGFRFIILNRVRSPTGLARYVDQLPLRSIAEDNERTLYIVQ